MIKLDGSFGEGGGAIARVALALSTITQKPFEMDNIRKGRCDPGLKAQHLYCVKALEELCSAKSEGSFLGSTSLRYFPGEIGGKTISVDIGTAGSISLFLQALLLPCFFADRKVRLKVTGGTDGKWAQPYDYFLNVFLPQIRRFAEIDVRLIRRGYYPKGGGKIDLRVNPKFKLNRFKDFNEFFNFIKNQNLDYELTKTNKLIKVKGVSHASNFLRSAEVVERQAKAAKRVLSRLNVPIKIGNEYCDSLCPGSGIVLWADFENGRVAGDALGERGKRAEFVGKEAAENLLKEIESGAPVDRYLGDQLLPYMALTKNSRIRVSQITDHTKTNIYVIEKFLDVKFKIEENVVSV